MNYYVNVYRSLNRNKFHNNVINLLNGSLTNTMTEIQQKTNLFNMNNTIALIINSIRFKHQYLSVLILASVFTV